MTVPTVKWLVLAIIVAALLPAGRDMLSEMALELAGTKPALRGDDHAKAGPRRAELDKSMAMLHDNPR
jgi:hypothetical protein